jgi:hypothetical protein
MGSKHFERFPCVPEALWHESRLAGARGHAVDLGKRGSPTRQAESLTVERSVPE